MSEIRVAPLLLGALFGAMVAGRPAMALACLGVAWLGAAAVGARWPTRRWWLALAIAIGITMFLNAWLVPGETLWSGPWGARATAEGLARGRLLALRLAGAAIALHGLRAAWPGHRAADRIAGMLGPLARFGLPVRDARMMVALSVRFAPLLASEAGRIARLQSLRAGRAPRGAGEWWLWRRAALVPTMVSTLERADRVAIALEARQYRSGPIATGPPMARLGKLAGWTLVVVSLVWR